MSSRAHAATRPTGLAVDFVEYDEDLPPATPTTSSSRPRSQRASTRTDAHTIRLEIDFRDGRENDVVKVYVDGDLKRSTGVKLGGLLPRRKCEQAGKAGTWFPRSTRSSTGSAARPRPRRRTPTRAS